MIDAPTLVMIITPTFLMFCFILLCNSIKQNRENREERENEKKRQEQLMVWAAGISFTELLDTFHSVAPESSSSKIKGSSLQMNRKLSLSSGKADTVYNLKEQHKYTFMVHFVDGNKKVMTVDFGTKEYELLINKVK